jgi:Translation initiation factor 2 (IF-2; GTPase)
VPRGAGARHPRRHVIYTTTISQLKRFKDDAREVAEGFECGILLENFNDEKEGDVLEASRPARSSGRRSTSSRRQQPQSRPTTNA